MSLSNDKPSCLKKWLTDNNYHSVLKRPDESESHFLYDGGVAYIPIEKEYEFLKLYSIDLKNNVELHYVERRKNKYKFMIDLDIYDTYCWSNEEIINVSKIINSTINEFYNNKSNNNSIDIYCIVCRIVGIPKIKDGLTHSGVHIIFPKLYVNDNIALMLREAVLQKIGMIIAKDKEDKEEKTNTTTEPVLKDLKWNDIFDPRIYEGNGFTMVGSHKVKEENIRIYMPFTVLNKNGSVKEVYLERLLNNYLDMMLDTSIRYIPEAFQESNIDDYGPTNVPEWLDKNIMVNMATVRPKRGNKNCMTDAQDMVYKIIHSAIIKFMPDYKHEPHLIREIFRYPDSNGSPDKNGALLISTNSKYCMNLGREHKSCGIYFYANRKGLCQKCLCPCNNTNGRKSGLCKNYTSEYFPFETDLCIVLFGQKKNIEFRKVPEDIDKQIDNACEIEADKKKKEKYNKSRKVVCSFFIWFL